MWETAFLNQKSIVIFKTHISHLKSINFPSRIFQANPGPAPREGVFAPRTEELGEEFKKVVGASAESRAEKAVFLLIKSWRFEWVYYYLMKKNWRK